jgi:carboxymethylenebutenolidase
MAGEMVQFQSNGQTASGYLALPPGGKGPGVIVIQEWWGLVQHIKEVADRLAAEGYVVLAPDFYHGEQTREPDEAGKLMMELQIERVEKDARGAVNYLLSHPAQQGEKVGIVGFCMGGQLALYAASKNPKIGACVVYYGGHPKFEADIATLQAPVLGFYAENDNFVTPEKARELEQALKAAGKTVEIHIYPDTDHAFFNDHRPEVYNAAAAQDTWRRMLAFFKQHLGK